MKVMFNVTVTNQAGLVMIIDCCPCFVQRFLEPVRFGLSRPQYRHLWTGVLAIAVTLRT